MPSASKIIKNGKVVLSYNWDTRGPGAGAGVEQIFCLKGKFAVASEYEGALGPFDSLINAIEQTQVLCITDAGESIECDSLSVSQIIDLLQLCCVGYEPVMDINGQTCEFDPVAQCYRTRELQPPHEME